MKRILLFLFCCFSLSGVFAQTSSGAERVQALKVKFITDRLGLTTEEAAKFWPVYNEFESKRDDIRKQIREINKQIADSTQHLSSEDYLKLADQESRLFQQDGQLMIDRNEALKKVLPPKKLALVFVAEEDFKKWLVQYLTNQNSNSNSGQK
jgi:hypothetical protein